uniref:Uncharacterized protein n=1 Tax=Setaria italica TaxID=4555 RepID=K4AHV1_SETIT
MLMANNESELVVWRSGKQRVTCSAMERDTVTSLSGQRKSGKQNYMNQHKGLDLPAMALA